MSLSSLRTQWPTPPSGASLSWLDCALLDLARHAARTAAMPLGTIEADTRELWNVLRGEADCLGPDVEPEPTVDMLEPFALTWARNRADERRQPNWI